MLHFIHFVWYTFCPITRKRCRKNKNLAKKLWTKSYYTAFKNDETKKEHPTFRLASIYLDSKEEEYAPILALRFYQEAEQTFLLEIKDGADYYFSNLNRAREGQEKARLIINGDYYQEV